MPSGSYTSSFYYSLSASQKYRKPFSIYIYIHYTAPSSVVFYMRIEPNSQQFFLQKMLLLLYISLFFPTMWIRIHLGPWRARAIKCRKKQSLTNFFLQEIMFFLIETLGFFHV